MSKTLVDVLDAVTARIETLMPVYNIDPDPTPSGNFWTILAVDGGNLYSRTLDNRREGRVIYFRPMVVGVSQASCLDARQMVSDLLEGWDMFPEEESSSLVEEEETSPPMLPSASVANQPRFSVTPTYRIRFDR